MEITNCKILMPAIINYKDNNLDKSTMVYLDYSNKEIFLSEDIENEIEFKKSLSNYIFNKKNTITPEFSLKEFKNKAF